MNCKFKSVLLVLALVAAMMPLAAQAKESDAKEAFLKENPKAVPYLAAIENSMKVLKAKQAHGFMAVFETKGSGPNGNEPLTQMTTKVQGERSRLEIERGSKKYTIISDASKMTVISAENPQGREMPNRRPRPQVAMAPWYSDAIRWVSFKKVAGEDKQMIPTLEGLTGEETIVLTFSPEEPGKITSIVTKDRLGATKKTETIEDYLKVGKVWMGKKIKSVQKTGRGEMTREATIKSIDWEWKPTAETFSAPAAPAPAKK